MEFLAAATALELRAAAPYPFPTGGFQFDAALKAGKGQQGLNSRGDRCLIFWLVDRPARRYSRHGLGRVADARSLRWLCEINIIPLD